MEKYRDVSEGGCLTDSQQIRPQVLHGAFGRHTATLVTEESAASIRVSFTRYTKHDGPLTKLIFIAEDGKKRSNSSQCWLSKGTAETITTPFSEFGSSLRVAQYNQAFGYGLCGHDRISITTKAQPVAGAIPRSKKRFRYPQGPAILMLDYDPPKSDDVTALSRAEVIAVLRSVIPGFDRAALFISPSVSSGLYLDGQPVSDSGGLHFYLVAANGGDIERFGRMLCQRLWLAGHGHILIAKNGSLLVRQTIDGAVFSPERLDFVAPPILDDPRLTQHRAEPEFRDGGMLDTALLRDLTDKEQAQYERLVEEAKARVRPKAARIRKAHIEREAPELAKRQGISEQAARETLERAYGETETLSGAFELHFEDHGVVTVADVLLQPERYDECDLLDPLEPDYPSGYCARFYANLDSGRPCIHSFAHGGRNFGLARTPILLRNGEMHRALDEVENALLALTDPLVFQRCGELVRVTMQPDVARQNAITRDGGSAVISRITPAALGILISQVVEFHKFDNRSKGEGPKKVDPPNALLQALVEKREWRVPLLEGVIHSPTLRADGSILESPGYDRDSGFYLHRSGYEFPRVPQTPSKADAEAALGIIRELFDEFPFREPHDESIAVAELLTAPVRRSLPLAPMFVTTAPVAGSGKTLLHDAIAVIATGRTATTISASDNAEEQRKRLAAVLAAGDAILNIDNLEHDLSGDALCSILTSGEYSDRRLGQTEMLRLRTNTLMCATGNNLVVRGDLTRRGLRCDLDPRHERPYEKSFKRDLLKFCRENRGRLVTAALTILRAHHIAGRPAPQLTPFGSFSEWSAWIRTAIVWLGMPDPCLSLADLAETDPERNQLAEVLEAWHGYCGSRASTLRVLIAELEVRACDEAGALKAALMQVAGERTERLNLKRLGKWLQRQRGRIVDGRRFERAGKGCQGVQWYVFCGA